MDKWRATFLGLKQLLRELTAFEIQTFFTVTFFTVVADQNSNSALRCKSVFCE